MSSPATQKPIIEFRKVDKAFGSRVVYKQMDLVIYEGETMAIIGGSGEGKSVCLKMMIGLLAPDSGQVLFKGQDINKMNRKSLREARRQVAYVFQSGALFDSMSVLDNLAYGIREHTQKNEEEIRARALECVEMVGLSADTLDLMPANLSGGMRKRVALARAIALQPEVILYDEPTTGLDPKNINRIGQMIIELQKQLKITSVVVTHDMPTAFEVSDRVAMLYKKAFPFVGTPQEIQHSEESAVRDFIEGTFEHQPATVSK